MQFTEHTVRKYLYAANELLLEHCPYYEEVAISEIKITRARSYWMKIQYNKSSDTYTLIVGSLFTLIDDLELFRIRFMSSCLHELIHTIEGCWNHGHRFKRICNMINNLFPEYKLSTSTSSSEFGVEIEERPVKYLITCTNCGTVSKYRRAPNYLKLFNVMYSCSCCGRSSFDIQKVS